MSWYCACAIYFRRVDSEYVRDARAAAGPRSGVRMGRIASAHSSTLFKKNTETNGAEQGVRTRADVRPVTIPGPPSFIRD
eukprot:2512633-Prymnesium_polylepis.1